MKVVVALSGGVDSSAAAILLKSQGHEVIGVHMQNWDRAINEGEDGCTSEGDQREVKEICRSLDIPLKIYNFVPEYWELVFQPYLIDLSNNLNTNPDIRCNANIKFGALLDRVTDDFGEGIKLATGHWARITREGDRYYLETCSNGAKDQTYFLSSLEERQLSRILFPLSNIATKEEVRRIVKDSNLACWNKRDSTGICFIGKRNHRKFIGKYLEECEGDFVEIETGKVLGRHKGTHLYVLHQRGGLFLKGYEEKYYVCGKDESKNIVYLCRKSELEKHLHTSRSKCTALHWISEDNRPQESEEIHIKTRHSPNFLEARIIEMGDGYCLLEHRRTYVTSPGQAIVFYRNRSRCLGMGIYVI